MLTSNQKHLEQISYRLDLFTHSKYRNHRHLSIWTLYWLIFLSNCQSPGDIEPYATYFRFGISVTIFIQAYLNMYWLVPIYLLNKNLLIYLIKIFIMLVFFSLIVDLATLLIPNIVLEDPSKRLYDPKPKLYFTFALIFVLASSAIKFFQRWIQHSSEITELSKINIRSESEQVKNQINTHFLFNMLNNANVLIDKDPQKASKVLISLHDLLRYQLYDSSRPEVLLTSEINFLTDCLNLEIIRRDHFDFIISREGLLNGVQVPSFLFITFVENAIKHSHDGDNPSYVNVYFEYKDGWVNFRCINSKPLHLIRTNQSGGLGLVNIKRRLDLISGINHQLNIFENKKTYTVELSIKL